LRRNRHHYFTAQTHDNIRIERQASDIFCSIHITRISCDSRRLYKSGWTLHSSVTGISKKIHETRSDEWHTAWINPRVPSVGLRTERGFHPVVSSCHQTYQADKRRSCYLGTGRHDSNTRNLEIITLARENHVEIICLPPTNSHKMYPWIMLSWSH
jgi:hypothetical protein